MDGFVLPRFPEESFRNGMYQHVDIMIGVVSNEWARNAGWFFTELEDHEIGKLENFCLIIFPLLPKFCMKLVCYIKTLCSNYHATTSEFWAHSQIAFLCFYQLQICFINY